MTSDRLTAVVTGVAAIVAGLAAVTSAVGAIVPTRPTSDRLPSRLADDRATSPTVGAVLLVGITVLLATTTGTHLFGLAGGSQTGFATATVEFSSSEDRVTVTWLVDAEADNLTVRVRVDDQRRTVELDDVGDEVVVDGDGVTVSADSVGHWESPTVSDGDRVSVTVTATSDGERMVVADRSQTV